MAESLLFVNEHVQSELADVDGPGRTSRHWRPAIRRSVRPAKVT